MRIIGNDPSVPRQTQEVASGTLPNGKPVVVNADGTVSSVGLVSISQNVGSGTVFESATTEYINSVFDSSTNRVVVVYKDDGNSNYGTAVVGSVSGNSISFGTPVVYQAGTVIWSKPVFDSTNNKIVIAYRKNSDGGDGGAIVGTVDASDNSISFGSETEFETGEISSDFQSVSAVFDSNEGKVVIVYKEATNSNYGMAIVGTVSGTSISFGSNTAFESSNTTNIDAAFDSNSNKVVIFYNASSIGKAIVGTVSGTSISFGSSVNITGNSLNEIRGAFDTTNNKMIVAYKDPDGTVPGEGCGIVGTVSGTSISFGSQTVFRSKNCNYLSIAFDSNANKIVVTYQNDTDNPRVGELVVGTVSGTSISFDTQVVFDSSISGGHYSYTSATFDSNSKKVVISFADSSNSRYGTSLVFQAAGSVPNLTSENYIGISRSGAASGAGAVIDTQGAIADNLSGLTAGQSYYVQTDGTLGTTAATPSVFAGTAVSATKLIVKG